MATERPSLKMSGGSGIGLRQIQCATLGTFVAAPDSGRGSSSFRKKRHMSGRTVLSACLLSVLTLIGAAPAAAQAGTVAIGGSTDTSIAAAPQITLVVGSVLSPPHVVTGADGRQHLAHELLLTNTAFFPIALTRLDTVDPATGAILESLRGSGLAARVKRPE